MPKFKVSLVSEELHIFDKLSKKKAKRAISFKNKQILCFLK